jgi:hypothetical protein
MEEDMGRQPNFDQSEQEQCSVTSSRFELFSSKQLPAGAFLPFVGEQQVVTAAPAPSGSTTGTTGSGADLSLSSQDHVSSPNGNGFGGAESEVGSIDVTHLRTPDQILDAQGCNLGIRPQSNGVSEAGSTRVFGSQSQRKSRRCWTPELHRRFVGALQQLGGSQGCPPFISHHLTFGNVLLAPAVISQCLEIWRHLLFSSSKGVFEVCTGYLFDTT